MRRPDGRNGLDFIGRHLGEIRDRDFGYLGVAPATHGSGEWINAFAVYRRRAARELTWLRASGLVSESSVASRLYDIRNSLAHGKRSTRSSDFGPGVSDVAGAVAIVKLLARIAVEP